MKPIVILADPHLGKFWKNNNSVFSRAKKLINYFILNLESIAKQFDVKPDLIIAGDIYDSIHANIEMLVYIKSKLNKVFDLYDDIYIIAGNHETFIDKNGTQQSLLYIALDTSRFHLYTNGIATKIINDINFIFVPHQTEIESLFDNQINSYIDSSRKNIIIGHTTPKEIFSRCKYSMNDYIDKWGNNVQYILLGHYHKPCEYTYKNTKVVSIGSMYYLTIDDIKENSNKRYLILDSNNKIIEKNLIMPKVYSYEVKNQNEFEDKIVKDIKQQNLTSDDIIYIKSKSIIDYSSLVFEGYDVYFDAIENTNESIITLKESISGDINVSNGKSLNDRWNQYINLLSEDSLSSNEIDTLNWLFANRNNLNITSNDLLIKLGNVV